MEFLAQHWTEIVLVASGVLAGAAMMLKAVAPYTKTDLDDKAASLIEKLLSYLNKGK